MKKISMMVMALLMTMQSQAAERFVSYQPGTNVAFTLAKAGKPTHILMDASEDEGIRMAAQNLSADFGRVTGKQASIVQTPEKETLIVGSLSSSFVKVSLIGIEC